MVSGKTTNTNVTVVKLTNQYIDSTMYHTWNEYG